MEAVIGRASVVVKSQPATEGGTASIWGDPNTAEQLSLWATTIEPVLSGPGTTNTEAMGPRNHVPQEKPPQWEPPHLTSE